MTTERASGPYIVSFVGRSGSGKTTLLERVIAALVARGLRVGVVKHHAHDIELDVPRKDSWRHAKAGAVSTVVSGPHQFALVSRVERERTLDELVDLLGEVDVVLSEGFRETSSGCVEVLRRAHSTDPVCSPNQLVAFATDLSTAELPPGFRAVRAFGLEDAEAIADAIASGSLAQGVA